jgi:site-specific recombinase XerD
MRTLDREFGSKTLQEMTTWEIEKFKSARREKLKVASVNRELAVLKHIFSRAVEWGKLKETPARKMKKLKGAIIVK